MSYIEFLILHFQKVRKIWFLPSLGKYSIVHLFDLHMITEEAKFDISKLCLFFAIIYNDDKEKSFYLPERTQWNQANMRNRGISRILYIIHSHAYIHKYDITWLINIFVIFHNFFIFSIIFCRNGRCYRMIREKYQKREKDMWSSNNVKGKKNYGTSRLVDKENGRVYRDEEKPPELIFNEIPRIRASLDSTDLDYFMYLFDRKQIQNLKEETNSYAEETIAQLNRKWRRIPYGINGHRLHLKKFILVILLHMSSHTRLNLYKIIGAKNCLPLVPFHP